MRLILSLIFTLTVFITFAPESQAQTSDEKKTLIKEMLVETDIGAVFKVYAQSMSDEFLKKIKEIDPKLSHEDAKLIESDVISVFEESIASDSFYEIFYPIWDKHFTVEELREISAFYKTPAGRKANKLMPQILQEALPATQVWAQGITPKIQQRLEMRLEEIEKKKKP